MEDVAADTERGRYLNAEEALAYGIVDEILEDAPKKDQSKSKTKEASEESETSSKKSGGKK